MNIELLVLSVKELFVQTLDYQQLQKLGLSNREIAHLFLSQTELTIEDLRDLGSRACVVPLKTNLFAKRKKLFALIKEDLKPKVLAKIKCCYKIQITRELLNVARLNMENLIPCMEDVASLASKLQLQDSDLITLGLAKNKAELFDTKCITLSFICPNQVLEGQRATECQFLARCTQVAQKHLGQRVKYFSCSNCLMFEHERQHLRETSQINAGTFGVTIFDGWSSTVRHSKRF